MICHVTVSIETVVVSVETDVFESAHRFAPVCCALPSWLPPRRSAEPSFRATHPPLPMLLHDVMCCLAREGYQGLVGGTSRIRRVRLVITPTSLTRDRKDLQEDSFLWIELLTPSRSPTLGGWAGASSTALRKGGATEPPGDAGLLARMPAAASAASAKVATRAQRKGRPAGRHATPKGGRWG